MRSNLYSAASNAPKTQKILFKPLIFTKNQDYLFITPFKVLNLKKMKKICFFISPIINMTIKTID